MDFPIDAPYSGQNNTSISSKEKDFPVPKRQLNATWPQPCAQFSLI